MILHLTDALTLEPTTLLLPEGLEGQGFEASAAAAELYLSPGWVDIQVNGYSGYDMNSAQLSPEDVKQMVRALWRQGVTQCLPTVITGSYEHITRCLSTIAVACQDPGIQASIAGIHLEGPYISPLEGARGAHPAEHVRPPDWQEFLSWQEAAAGLIRLVTLSPEHPNAIDFIARATAAGVTVALGHTMASTGQIEAAVAAGAKLSTHLGNGAPALIQRHPNPIWDQLAEDRLAASFIFDGHHLPVNVMKVMLRAKGKDKAILTSDAVALAGMAPGVYETPVGGKVELHASGRLTLFGTSYLAGSASPLGVGIRNALRLPDCSLPDAMAMASLNPASLLDISQERSKTVFRYEAATGEVTPVVTMVAGEVKYVARAEAAPAQDGK